jgi:GT2 family glycosyltransferase
VSLVFPDPPAPDATVIVVVHNAWDWTRRALEALRENTAPQYQLVVVDNASTDGAAEGLNDLRGAVVLRNATNLGFGPAANQGAVWAAARHLVFLNSDALVHEDWLPPLLQVADAEEDVAAVGGRLLNVDGTLQEAGTLVWREGRVNNYGDGDDPRRPEYRFRRDVDYASAALLLVRRAAFVASGGFDPVYAPAYVEDMDLCFGLRAAGWRIVYQPRSTATHVRWASGERSSTVDLVDRNLPIFIARYAAELSERPPYPGVDDDRRLFLAARDHGCPLRLLVVAGRADAAVAHQLADLQRTSPGARLTLLTAEADDTAATALQDQGLEVIDGPPDWLGALAERRLHYDAVLAADDVAERAGPVAATTQPQAPVVRFGRDDDGASLIQRAIDAGAFPPTP